MFKKLIDRIIGRYVIEIRNTNTKTKDVYYVKYQKHSPPRFTRKKDNATRFDGKDTAKDIVKLINFYGWLPKRINTTNTTIEIKRTRYGRKTKK
ncbi:MAG: hypothetical protein HDQ88_06440 [Clostridia bacterium]|nr:hypothetical protein [Clostridia bacterium]